MRAALTWAHSRKKYIFFALAISLVASLGIFHFVYAVDTQSVMDSVLLFITKIIQYGMQALTAVVLFLVQMLIKAAQYNDFVHAYPVETGWSLVRDVVNMFFIVVLLVMAFATIIGYEPLHYKNYLPKLLVMAVLINFSKTLIGVAIDFSQVIMLTFVNGFKAAAGGNFINALKLTKVAQMSQDNLDAKAKSGEASETPGNLLIASVLGLGMLFISAGVILVFVIFILARIIGLWIALIFSPLALFATALPDKMKKGLSAFTNDYWSKLTSMLTGGPIIAFFLWLSLATVQGKPDQFQFYNPDAKESVSASVAITQAGQPADLSAFVVAIVMLLMGLQAAVSSANAVSPYALQAGNLAKNLALGTTKWAAKKSYRTGVAAGRGTFRMMNEGVLAKGGKSFTERMGGKMLETAGRGGVGSGIMARAGARLAIAGGARRAEIRSAQESMLKGLTPAQRLQYDRAHETAGSTLEQTARKQRILDVESSDFGKRMFKDQSIQKYYRDNKIDPKTATADQKKAAENFAAGNSKRMQANSMADLKKMYDDAGDSENSDKLKKKISEDPSLNNDIKAIYGEVGSKDYTDVLKDTKPDAYADSAFAAAFAKSYGLVKPDGTIMSAAEAKSNENTKDLWEKLSKNPKRRKAMEQHMEYWATADGKKALTSTLSEMDGSGAAGSSTRYHMASSGERYTMSAGTGAAMMAPPPEFTPGQQELLTKYSDVATRRTEDAASGIGEMTRAGIRPSKMGVYDSSTNSFTNDSARDNYGMMLSGASLAIGNIGVDTNEKGEVTAINYVSADDTNGRQKLENSIDTFANLDSSAILAGGEYADSVVQNVDIATIDRAMANLDGLSNSKAERRVQSERAEKIAQVKDAITKRTQEKVKEIQEKVTKAQAENKTYEPDSIEAGYLRAEVQTSSDEAKKILADEVERIKGVAKTSSDNERSARKSQASRERAEQQNAARAEKWVKKVDKWVDDQNEKKQSEENKKVYKAETAESKKRIRDEKKGGGNT